MSSFKELRDKLSPEDIKRILATYNVQPYYEGPTYIIYPTVCHNLSDNNNSYKLYYYKNNHMFKCYTHCGIFDIFELIIKLEEQLGHKIGKIQAIQKTGLQINSRDVQDLAEEAILKDYSFLYEANNTEIPDLNNLGLQPIDASFLDERFTFDINGLKTWMDEGISLNTMVHYKITYDPIDNCIIVPQFDQNGAIVGVRGRYLNPDAPAKYKPIIYNGQLLNHPKNKTLYGFYQNKEAISMTKTAIIFEGEKSVLKLDTYYDKKNISVAVCGQTISAEQIQLLLDAKVTNIVVAFDADYITDKETQAKFLEYKKICKPLMTYFNVSLVMDFNHKLGYKDSPIDKGIDIFNELMKDRIYL